MNDLRKVSDDQAAPGETKYVEPTRLLSNAARDRLLALLESDEGPNQALKEAAELYKQGYHVGDVYHFKA